MIAERRGPKTPDSVDVDVGRLIRVQRLSRGLTLTQLATNARGQGATNRAKTDDSGSASRSNLSGVGG
jgi:hypothetical protein